MSVLSHLVPVERNSLADQVYLDLRSLIMSGRLRPGDKISLREVAKVLDVSVMPVRDAVNRLVAEQALLSSPNRGYYVPQMTPAEFRELADIRIEVEGYAAAQAVARHTSAELAEIRLEERRYHDFCHAPAPEISEAIASNMRLHFLIYRAAHMPLLASMIEALWLRAGPIIVLETAHAPERLRSGGSFLRHAEMMDALQRRDAATMRDALARDIRATADFILNSDSLILNRR